MAGQVLANYKIIGVVKDMVNQSPYDPANQTFFFLANRRMNNLNIRINPKMSMHDALARITAVFKKYDAGMPFSYQFIDADYAKKFDNEERVGKLAGCFAGLAVFISCLGLFGMASFVAEQRIKEIGIRKVLGATVFNLWRLLSKDFVLLVFIGVAYCFAGILLFLAQQLAARLIIIARIFPGGYLPLQLSALCSLLYLP